MPDELDYFVGLESVTHIGTERQRRVRVSYYQWAPLILFMQGLCFYIPFLIWNSCANNAGVKLRRLLKKASDIASLPPGCQQREALLAEFVDQFHTLVMGDTGWCADLQWSAYQHHGSSSIAGSSGSGSSASGGSSANQPQGGTVGRTGAQRGAGPGSNVAGPGHHADDGGPDGGRHQSGRHHSHGGINPSGCCLVSIPIIGHLLACCLKPCSSLGLVGPSKYLCLLYLAVKFAYVFNVGLQFFLLGQFLGRGYLKHGLELLNRLIINGYWWASPRFPLSTLCQVRADMSGGLRTYTCQCVLPINVFNEKIFSVVWFYMAFLMPLNLFSLLFWIYRTFETNRLAYIRLCLWRTRLVELNQIHRTVRRLSQSYLGWDGVFLLRLIEHNHGSIMATLIMSRLWEFYANQMKLQEDANQLALASNAQHTLSNTTTAISNQHQLLAAAAAAAQQQQHQGHPQHGPGGGHSHPGGIHGGGGGGHSHTNHSHGAHTHSHGAPLIPTQLSGGHSFAHGHSHGPSFPIPLQPQQQPHGAHGHHSGQVVGQGSAQHPLHAANTHHSHHPAAHHPFGSSSAAAAAAALASANASTILAQLQQQQQQQQQHHGSHAAQTGQSGNVSAAVAALAAAAAAANHNNHNQANNNSISHNTSNIVTNHNNSSNSASSAANSHQTTQLSSQAQSGNQASVVASNNNNININTNSANGNLNLNSNSNSNSNSNNNSSNSNQDGSTGSNQPQSTTALKLHHPPIHLHSLMQSQAQQQQQTANTTTGTVVTQQPQQQQSSANQLGPNNQPGGVGNANQTSNNQQSGNNIGSQQQGVSATGNAGNQAGIVGTSTVSTNTTSFITPAPVGPPLPPPPPAHVVAAVAAAASSGSPVVALATSGSQVTPNGVRANQAGALIGRGVQASQAITNSSVVGQQVNGISGSSGNSATVTLSQQPVPPPHSNQSSLLFNLKSSNIQAATSGTRYAHHTVKRS